MNNEIRNRLQHALDHAARNGSVLESHVAVLKSDIRALLAAAASDGQAEPIYQVNHAPGMWEDCDKASWEPCGDAWKRIVYTHPSAEIAALRKERDQALLDAEQARNERNRVGVEIRRELLAEATAQVAALRERIAGMEKDAERYRWLRGEGFDRPAHMWVTKLPDGIPIVHSDLDEAIDAEIAKEQK